MSRFLRAVAMSVYETWCRVTGQPLIVHEPAWVAPSSGFGAALRRPTYVVAPDDDISLGMGTNKKTNDHVHI
jgi:hypothetical protein